MTAIFRGRRSIWWGWMGRPVAPRKVNDVSNHVCHTSYCDFSWQACVTRHATRHATRRKCWKNSGILRFCLFLKSQSKRNVLKAGRVAKWPKKKNPWVFSTFPACCVSCCVSCCMSCCMCVACVLHVALHGKCISCHSHPDHHGQQSRSPAANEGKVRNLQSTWADGWDFAVHARQCKCHKPFALLALWLPLPCLLFFHWCQVCNYNSLSHDVVRGTRKCMRCVCVSAPFGSYHRVSFCR